MKTALISLTVFFPLALTGCSKFHKYIAEVVVIDATTGDAIEGVEVIEIGSPAAVKTDSDGKARSRFRVSYLAFENGKYTRERQIQLKFSKKGYREEIIDVTPTTKPKSSGTTTVKHRVSMKRAAANFGSKTGSKSHSFGNGRLDL